ncbi:MULTISPECIES: transporter substrate-binding domain-containing protein [unclassified Acinetobacter]|uniref:transporter substrate-binding domain-containing protein n=1 Tax=unclassified Acinetobacter TaxID=196816 RepID=UPI0035B7A482
MFISTKWGHSLSLCSLMLLAACSGKAPTTSSASEAKSASQAAASQVQTNDPNLPVYTLGVDADYAPYSLRGEKGVPSGFDVEVLQAVAKDQGFTLKTDLINWNVTREAIKKQSYDILGGGLHHTDVDGEEGMNEYSLSQPYIFSADTIVSKEGAGPYNSLASLKDVKVSLLSDTAYVDDITKIKGTTATADNLITRNTAFLNLQDLATGRAEATVGDSGVMSYYLHNIKTQYNLSFKIHGKIAEYHDNYPLIFVLKNSQTDLAKKINTGLLNVVKSGEYQTIYQKWFHQAPIKLPNGTDK